MAVLLSSTHMGDSFLLLRKVDHKYITFLHASLPEIQKSFGSGWVSPSAQPHPGKKFVIFTSDQ
jgi:hypothetical protein